MRAAAFLLLVTCALVQALRPMNVHDLHALRRLQSFSVSTNGNIVYDVRHWEESTNTKTTHLELMQISGSGTRVLTHKAGQNDFSPAFASDNSVVFLSTRSGSSQLWRIQTDSGNTEPSQITSYPLDVDTFKWSPSGYFVFSTSVYVDCPTLQCTAERDAVTSAKSHTTGVLYEELFVRHWDVWVTPNKVSHLFLQRYNISQGVLTLIGQPIDLMRGMVANSPVPPDGGAEHYAISPDGREVAITAALVNHDSAWTTGWRTFTVAVNPSTGSVSSPVDISTFTQARTQNPLYSPDGSRIAFLSMDRPGFEADRLHLVVYDRSSKSVNTVAGSWDRSIGGFTWDADGSSFFVDADDDGRHKVFRIDGISGAVAELISTGDNMALTLIGGPSTQLVLMRHSYTSPADLFLFSNQGGSFTLRQLTWLNKGLLAQVQLSTPTSVYFKSANNSTVQAWLFQPYGFSASSGKTWPLAHVIHGGPQGAWTDAWSYRWNPQLWAARGYFVLLPNPHGSSGFGQAFEDAVSKDWGGVPFQDVMNSLDYVLAAQPQIDPKRVCACGASYGGFMMNWLNSQTNRYQCLVNHDGVFDTVMMYYSTDEIWFMEWEFGGKPTTSNLYQKFNPAAFVANWQTPTLVVHGGMDFRIPVTQGIATFTALQRKGIPSQLLHFPDENHWVLKPQNGIKWYDTVLSWLDQWTHNTPPTI